MKKPKIKKVGKVISNIVFTLFILLIVYIVIKVVIGALTSTAPCLFNHYVFVVATPSMDPTIAVGDIVLVKRATIDVVAQGDIISFISIDPSQAIYGHNVVHRVVDIETIDGVLTLTTRGDANPIADVYKVTADNFVGVVDFISPGLGKIYSTFISSYFIIFMLVFVFLMYFIMKIIRYIMNLKKEEAKKAREEEEKDRIKQEILKELEDKKGE